MPRNKATDPAEPSDEALRVNAENEKFPTANAAPEGAPEPQHGDHDSTQTLPGDPDAPPLPIPGTHEGVTDRVDQALTTQGERTGTSNDSHLDSPELSDAAAAARDASRIQPNAPPAPTDGQPPAELDPKQPKPQPEPSEHGADGLHEGKDSRLHMALDLAKRGLAYASINDLAKAVLLMLDVHHTPAPHESSIAKSVARGEVPPLL